MVPTRFLSKGASEISGSGDIVFTPRLDGGGGEMRLAICAHLYEFVTNSAFGYEDSEDNVTRLRYVHVGLRQHF